MMGIRKKPCFLRVSRGGRQGVLHPICTPKCKIASVNRGQILANLLKLMVPPDRIELSTSPLPMARSTPELRRLDLGCRMIIRPRLWLFLRRDGAHNAIALVSLQASLDEVFFRLHHGGRLLMFGKADNVGKQGRKATRKYRRCCRTAPKKG